MCTSSSFFDMAVILLFCLTTHVDLLSIHRVQSLSRMLLLSLTFVCFAMFVAAVILVASAGDCIFGTVATSEFDKLDLSESSESMITSAGLYSMS